MYQNQKCNSWITVSLRFCSNHTRADLILHTIYFLTRFQIYFRCLCARDFRFPYKTTYWTSTTSTHSFVNWTFLHWTVVWAKINTEKIHRSLPLLLMVIGPLSDYSTTAQENESWKVKSDPLRVMLIEFTERSSIAIGRPMMVW